MEIRKKAVFGKKALSFALAVCMIVTTFAPTVAAVAYADDSGASMVTSSSTSVSSDADDSASVSIPESGSTSQPGADTSDDENAAASSPESSPDSQPTSDSSSASSGSSSSESQGQNDTSVPADTSVPEDDSTSTDTSVSADTSVPADSNSNSDSSTSVPTEEEDASSSTSSSASEEPNSEGEDIEENPAEEFVALTVLDPESGATTVAEIGDEVTLSAGLSRDDVEVSYQWQRMQLPLPEKEVEGKPIHDYAEKAPTWYSFALTDVTEAEALAQNPDTTWPGIETYLATVDALNAIGADSSNVSFVWKTPNYALDGYTISAENVDGTIKVYAEKDGQRYVAERNEDGKFAFSETSEEVPVSATENVWLDIEGATDPSYTFTVAEEDYYAQYRLKVTILDEDYLAKCIEALESQDVELTDEQKAEQQNVYSIAMTVESATKENTEFVPDEVDAGLAAMVSLFAENSTPYLSDDGQWICGLNGNYQYITEDTYNRVMQWYREGKITDWNTVQRYWTYLRPDGWNGQTYANVLDENGFPTGATRTYNGFNLTDGKLEVASEWYGKTVLFRVAGTNSITKIQIPAYTELYGDGDRYDEAASGSKYKKAITFLNPYTLDTGSMYDNFLKYTSSNGWIGEMDGSGSFTGKLTDNHIEVYTVDAESFNRDPQRYMVDAEGNYRMDSVGWGVCTYQEPDISGKAYWVLKDYIANGYGFLTGHDTMYAYAGAYYDAFRGMPFDESQIDPNDGTTWYYDLNSWAPGTTGHDPNGNTSAQRGGHFYMNELMGSNAGNVYSGTVTPSDAPSLILSTGGSHGMYGKQTMYGSEQLNVLQLGYSAELAKNNPRYRTPTNYPYAFDQGQNFGASFTHTNGQAAFGTIWVNYAGGNKGASEWGAYEDPMQWTIDNKVGTNNFYLTGSGNYLMNQIGHLPENSASNYEAILFSNSVMYVSQRKQCEICAANQNGQETSHFVRRVSNANATEVFDALRNGGSYWYPIDGCYMLTEDITLPSGWTPIKGFRGHWDNDVYTINLNGATSLFDTTVADGENGWNLGTDKSHGTQNVFNGSMTRTTGIARVVGDLNDLFGTKVSYAGYTVKILGADNTKYGLGADEVYSCTVNTDSKYVISNLPCLYDGVTGTLVAHVYDPNGAEVTQYGKVVVRVSTSFWETCNTIPLELLDFSALGPGDKTIWVSQDASFVSTVLTDDPEYCANASNITWQFKAPGGSWTDVAGQFEYSINHLGYVNTGDPTTSGAQSELVIRNAPLGMDGYEFRIKYQVPGQGERETTSGKLTVLPPTLAGEITGDQTVWVRYKDNWGNALDYTVPGWDWPGRFGISYNKPGSNMFNDNYANYTSTFTFDPKLSDGNVPVVTWKYRTGVLGTEKVLGTVTYNAGSGTFTWNPNTAEINSIKSTYGAPNLDVNTTNSIRQNADGKWVVESRLGLVGCSTRMDIDNTRFFFRATATSNYGSGASAMTLEAGTTSSAMVIEYEVDIIPNQGVKQQANQGANWNFPNVKVYAPNGIRTGVVTFYHTNHHAADQINIGALPSEIGVAYQTSDYIILYSKNGNLLPASTWETAFRNLRFYVEDPKDSITDDISWYIDEDGDTSKYAVNIGGGWDFYQATNLRWGPYSGGSWLRPELEEQYNTGNQYYYPNSFTDTVGVISGTKNIGKIWNDGRPEDAEGYKYATFTIRRGYSVVAGKNITIPAGLDKLELNITLNQDRPIEINFTIGGRAVGYSDSWNGNTLTRVYNLGGLSGNGYFEIKMSEDAAYSMTQVRYTNGTDSWWVDDLNGNYVNERLTVTAKVNSLKAQVRNFERSNKSAVGYSEVWADSWITPPPVDNPTSVTVGILSDADKVYNQLESKAWMTVSAPTQADVNNIRAGAYMTYYKIVNGQRVAVSSGPVSQMEKQSKCIDAGDYVAVIRFDSTLKQTYNINGLNSNGELEKGFRIFQRPVDVHSKYLEADGKVRNVKAYDSTDAATVTDIIIDGILSGDAVELNAKSYQGTYATSQAGETLTAEGKPQTDRMKKLQEISITVPTDGMYLTGASSQNYYIANRVFSGAIYRQTLMAQVASSRTMYGQNVDYGNAGKPWHDTVPYQAGVPATKGCWLMLDGLVGNDTLTLDYSKSDFKLVGAEDGTVVGPTTAVGKYPLTYVGLTEANYPVLSNYLVSVLDGVQEVYAREIVITAEDINRYVLDESVPDGHSTFELMADDGTSYTTLGSDKDTAYEDMHLVGDDTIANTILVGNNPISKDGTVVMKEFGEGDEKVTVFQNGTNIPYSTNWYNGAPAIYLNIESDPTVYPCEWCEQYHGFKLGTDHWRIDGYNLTINQNPDNGAVLSVAQVENELGEMVSNYSLRIVDGLLYVHPELRFQLEATVPLYVCMYGYGGDGEVVEPTTYNITNYSNGPIEITDIDVSNDGWAIVDKQPADLLRGEMAMRLKDTQLVMGHNKPRNPDQWVVEADTSENEQGVEMLIPMSCQIAGGNVNAEGEAYIAHVTYTIAEHGITVPEVDGVEIPDFIHGEPVTVDKNG